MDLRDFSPEYYFGSVTRVQNDAVSAEPLELKSGWAVEQAILAEEEPAILAEEEPLVLVVIRLSRQGGCMHAGWNFELETLIFVNLFIYFNKEFKGKRIKLFRETLVLIDN